MSCFTLRSTTPNSNSSDDPQNNRFILLDQSLDDSQAGPSTITFDNDQLASAVASHLCTSSIEQPAEQFTIPMFVQVVAQLASDSDSSSGGPETNMDQAFKVIPEDVNDEQIAQIVAIFNVNQTQATNLTLIHALP
jgi:hypothetical protein